MTSAAVPILLGLSASAATMLGGLLALRLQREVATIVGLAAGAVFGLAVFDLLPEAVQLGRDLYRAVDLIAIAAVAFLAYAAFSLFLSFVLKAGAVAKAQLGLTSMSLHSLMDGLGIGFAFQLSDKVGWMVAAAILAHDVADGCNTVALALVSEDRRLAQRWLLANSVAPTLGVIAASQLRIAAEWIAPTTAILSGAFLYVAISQLLPRSRTLQPGVKGYLVNLLGALLIYSVTELIG